MGRFATLTFLLGLVVSTSAHAVVETISFQNIDHQIVVAGLINGIKARFIVDTGAGLDIISPTFCEKIHCQIDGSYTGERTPGEVVTLNLTYIKSLTLGRHKKRDAQVAIYPLLDQLPSEFGRIDGMLSLEFFRGDAFSLNYKNYELIFENSKSLKNRMSSGAVVPVAKEEDRSTLTVSVDVLLNGDTYGRFLVDAGTQKTLVNADLLGSVQSLVLADAPQIGEEPPAVMFRKLGNGGSLGSQFLKNYLVTMDLRHWKMIFNSN